MKNLFVFSVFALALTACNNDKTVIKKDEKTVTTATNGSGGTATPTKNVATTSAGSGWTNMQRTAFVKDCTSGLINTMEPSQADNYCTCMGEKLEAAYPKYNDLKALSANDLKKLAADCFKKQQK